MRYFLHQINYYITIFFISVILNFLQSTQVSGQSIDFTRSHDLLINIKGRENTYAYVGRYFDGRYNSRLRRFEFQMPLNEVYAANSASEMNVFNTVFLQNSSSTELTDGFRLFAYLQQSVPSFTEFRNGRALVLEGECTIGGVKYKMPVNMQVRYQDGALYYSLETEILYNFQNIILPAAAAGVQLKQIQFLIRDGVVRVLLEG